jgi:predicted nucleic acid-binding protein
MVRLEMSAQRGAVQEAEGTGSMSRTPARFTQADLARAIRAAKAEGMIARVLPDGTIEIVEKADDHNPEKAVAASREFSL